MAVAPASWACSLSSHTVTSLQLLRLIIVAQCVGVLPVAGAGERLHVYEHAVGLRGGFESLLGFVEGAAAAGRAHEAAVYVAACRWVSAPPFSVAPHCSQRWLLRA